MSADSYNRSRISTFVCVTVTSNLELADAPGNVLLPRGSGELPQDSVVNVSQLVTLDKRDAVERIGKLNRAEMRLVDAGISRVLDLRDPPAAEPPRAMPDIPVEDETELDL